MALELSPTLETRIRTQAAKHGLTVEQLLERTLQEETETQPSAAAPPNERVLATLDKIRTMNAGRPITTDGSDTKRLLREARNGAMYDRDPTE